MTFRVRTFKVLTYCLKSLWHRTLYSTVRRRQEESGVGLPVIYDSVFLLRSLNSIISILINMCFISPLKHTAWTFTVSRKHSDSSVWPNFQYFLVWEYMRMLNQGPFNLFYLVCQPDGKREKCDQTHRHKHTHTDSHTHTQTEAHRENPVTMRDRKPRRWRQTVSAVCNYSVHDGGLWAITPNAAENAAHTPA